MTVDELNQVLKEWEGSAVQVAQFSMSHSHFRIQLIRGHYHDPKLIVMAILPSHYRGPLSWGESALQAAVTPDSEKGAFYDEVRLIDPEAGFELRCHRAYTVPDEEYNERRKRQDA